MHGDHNYLINRNYISILANVDYKSNMFKIYHHIIFLYSILI